MTFTKDKKIIHNFVNFQTSQKVMFVYPFPASRANKELILYPDNKKIKHAWSNPEQNIWISQWYQRQKTHSKTYVYQSVLTHLQYDSDNTRISPHTDATKPPVFWESSQSIAGKLQ